MRKLKITFHVQELLDDAEIPDTEGRQISFGDIITPSGVKDFFYRSGLAVSTVFGSDGPHAVVLPQNMSWKSKIQAIKAVREMTGVGLKEAKEACERQDGVFMICPDFESATLIARKFEQFTNGRLTVQPMPADVSINNDVNRRYTHLTESSRNRLYNR